MQFERLKDMVTKAPVLRYFDMNIDSTIQCDASSKGLGATLLQEGQPVIYSSRSLTPAEEAYSQIEKEMLAIVFAAKKYHQYIYGKKTKV